MNLAYKDDGHWFTTGMAYEPDTNDPLQRGALIKVPLTGGGFSQFARGMRNTNGLGIGPEDEFFIAENQGHWKPTNVLYWVPTKIIPIPTNGRFFGYRTKTNNECKLTPPPVTGTNCPNDPEYPPAVWIPYGSVSYSPTRPILLKESPYAGQMIGGDVFFGGTLRYFLEKVNGEWQGAVFPMMTAGPAGIIFGINQFLYTPTGSLLAAGIGGGACGLGGSNNWAWNGTSDFGRKIQGSLHRGRVVLEIPFAGAWRLEILNLDGTRAAYASGIGPRRFETAVLPPGPYVAAGHAANGRFGEKIQVH